MESLIKQEERNVTLKYSYNPTITSEMSKTDAAEKSWGWKPKEVLWQEKALTEMVKKYSYLPSKLSDGHKVIKSVEEVYFLPLDFDSGSPTIEEFKMIAKKWQFSWFLHTTSSHRKEKKDKKGNILPAIDKFRVVIPFDKPISRKEMISMTPFWLDIFPTLDQTCFQGERFYYRSEEATTYLHQVKDKFGDDIPVFMSFSELPLNKYTSQEKPDKAKRRNKKSDNHFKLETELLLADRNTIVKVKEIKEHTPIFCPFCDHDEEHRSNPNSANAFININGAGQYYIHCSSENKRYWQDPEQLNPDKSNLFWNTSLGCPSAINYKTVYEETAYYVFKNDADFRNYCRQKNINAEIKEYLPRREIIFDPSKKGGLTEEYYNVFEESEYMKKNYGSERIQLDEAIKTMHNKTPFIHMLMINIFGEEEYLSRFMNWCAYILQERKKANTSWLITSEEQGIGKDLIFNHVLRPLFGEHQSQMLHGDQIGRKFNSQDVNCFLRGYNEVFGAADPKTNNTRKEWLKDKITGVEQTIEFKGVDSFQTRNFMNIILFSNSRHSILLDKNDRRFNVIRNMKAKKVQSLPFFTKESDLEPSIASEINEFARIVFTLNYDRDVANTAIDTRAKNDLIECSSDPYEAFAEALKTRDVDYFLFDEVFPVSSKEEMLEQRTTSAIAEELTTTLIDKGILLSTHMNKITKYHFQRSDYKSILNRLKLKGVKAKSIKFENNKVKKGYYFE